MLFFSARDHSDRSAPRPPCRVRAGRRVRWRVVVMLLLVTLLCGRVAVPVVWKNSFERIDRGETSVLRDRRAEPTSCSLYCPDRQTAAQPDHRQRQPGGPTTQVCSKASSRLRRHLHNERMCHDESRALVVYCCVADCGPMPATSKRRESIGGTSSESLSGPGPFKGVTFRRTSCSVSRRDAGRQRIRRRHVHHWTSTNKIRALVNAEFGYYTSGDKPRFARHSKRHTLGQLDGGSHATYIYRVSPLLDLGAGAGVMIFHRRGFRQPDVTSSSRP